MIYLKLFLSFLQIGCFSFGGGYAAMPLIQEQVVTLNHWLTLNAFTDLITIAEMTPGPIAINAATFVGTQIAGPLGAIVATLGCILPSCVFVTLLAYIYSRYKKFSLLQGTLSALRPAVVAMIAKAGITILVSAFFVDDIIIFSRSAIELRMILYFVIAMILLRKVKLSPIVVMLSCGDFELVYYIFNYVVLHT